MEDVLRRATEQNVSVMIPFYGFLNKLLCDGHIEILQRVCKIGKPLVGQQPFDERIEQILRGRMIEIGTTFTLVPLIEANPNYPFYLGSNRYFSNYFAISYSRILSDKTKKQLDSLMYIIFESGLYQLWLRTSGTKLAPTFLYFQIKDDNGFYKIGTNKMKGVLIVLLLSYFYFLILFKFKLL